MLSLTNTLKSAVKWSLASLGIKIHRPIRGNGYVSAKDTLSAAATKGMSVCEYVEELWGQQGRTQAILDRLTSVAGLSFCPATALEIGPGTGRYLDATLKRYPNLHYEIYETATDWADWLAATYPIIRHVADGHSLIGTVSNSIDIIQCHGVFVYLPFLTTYEYLSEIERVARCEAIVILDLITESCMTDEVVGEWLADGARYPTIFPRDYLVGFFQQRQFKLMDSFQAACGAGLSEYFIFRRG